MIPKRLRAFAITFSQKKTFDIDLAVLVPVENKISVDKHDFVLIEHTKIHCLSI